MNTTPPSRPAPMHVPVLTEVVELDEVVPRGLPDNALAQPPEAGQVSPTLGPVNAAVGDAPTSPAPVVAPPLPAPAPAPMPSPVITPRPAPTGLSFDEAQMTQRVLVEVQRQIDGMLEYRLRETLAPILARTSEALVRELRQELSKTMRDVVSRAVAQEVVRQRSR